MAHPCLGRDVILVRERRGVKPGSVKGWDFKDILEKLRLLHFLLDFNEQEGIKGENNGKLRKNMVK